MQRDAASSEPGLCRVEQLRAECALVEDGRTGALIAVPAADLPMLERVGRS